MPILRQFGCILVMGQFHCARVATLAIHLRMVSTIPQLSVAGTWYKFDAVSKIKPRTQFPYLSRPKWIVSTQVETRKTPRSAFIDCPLRRWNSGFLSQRQSRNLCCPRRHACLFRNVLGRRQAPGPPCVDLSALPASRPPRAVIQSTPRPFKSLSLVVLFPAPVPPALGPELTGNAPADVPPFRQATGAPQPVSAAP